MILKKAKNLFKNNFSNLIGKNKYKIWKENVIDERIIRRIIRLEATNNT